MGLAEAADANLASSAGYLIERGLLPGGSVQRLGNVTVIDSGLPDDTYNLVVGASNMNRSQVDRTIDAVRSTGRPFAWWVAPVAEQAGLAGLLAEAGLGVNEREPLMIGLTGGDQVGGDLEIELVDTPEALNDFARIDAHLWNPPNTNVVKFFELSEQGLLSDDYPGKLLVGRANGEAVCCTELHYAHGVAGLYNVATLESERRKGYARSTVNAALAFAKADGYDTAILQSSPAGQPLYRALAFSEAGEYIEFAVK